MSIKRRLAKLEQTSGQGRKMFVLYRFDHESEDEADRAAGIEPSAEDLVVYLTKFCPDSPLANGRLVSARNLN